jgi:hypothetical protein
MKIENLGTSEMRAARFLQMLRVPTHPEAMWVLTSQLHLNQQRLVARIAVQVA